MSGMQTHPHWAWNLLSRGFHPVDLLKLQFHGVVHHFLNRPCLYNQWSLNWRPVEDWESHLIFKDGPNPAHQTGKAEKNMIGKHGFLSRMSLSLHPRDRKMWLDPQSTRRSPDATQLPDHRKTVAEKQRQREPGRWPGCIHCLLQGDWRRAPLHAVYSRAKARVRECQVLIHHRG